MSQYLEQMKLGDSIEVKGPLGHFIYDGRGKYRNSAKPGTARVMSMIAGGTGITPMFQIIKVGVCASCVMASDAAAYLSRHIGIDLVQCEHISGNTGIVSMCFKTSRRASCICDDICCNC